MKLKKKTINRNEEKEKPQKRSNPHAFNTHIPALWPIKVIRRLSPPKSGRENRTKSRNTKRKTIYKHI